MKVNTLVFFFLLVSFGLKAQNPKVVGFLPHYRFDQVDNIDFNAITHLNLAFANPDMEGNLSFENAPIAYTINKAKEHDVEVFVSLAGGYLLPEWELAWNSLMKEENRSAFIHKIVKYVENNNCDGVDVDLEWQYVDALYSPFVNDLIDSLHAHELLCSASLPGTYRYPEITDETLEKLDWINMMVYDLTGPWDPENAGPHSPYSFAESSLFYWNGEGVANERLTLGMPFYGYDFEGNQGVTSFTYRYMVHMDEENAYLDQVEEKYYNGIPTIKAKTQLAIEEELLGIMIWELGQDHYSDFSLLQAIDEEINAITSFSEEQIREKASVFPNPFVDQLYIKHAHHSRIQLYDMNGRMILNIDDESKEHKIDGHSLAPGLYVLRVLYDDGIEIRTVSKTL